VSHNAQGGVPSHKQEHNVNERPQAKIVELIQKILSKTTESGCTEAEASEAFAKAQAMLLKHNLSMDDVRCKDNKDGEEQFSDEAAFQTGRWTYEQNLAYHVIKNHCFIEGYFRSTAGKDKVLFLFGTQANVATARFMFTALLAATERMWIVYKYTRKRPASEGRMFRTGMIKGFSDKLDQEREALKMEQDILKGSTGGTALAIIRIDQLTVAKYKEAHPENTGRKGRANFADLAGDASTLQAGYDAGKRLNLNRAIGRNGGRKAIE